MSTISRTIDRYYAMQIMSKLSKEFPEWPAFKTGVIDALGNVVNRPKTKEEKDSYTRLDAVLRSIKKILNKFPGGVSALARAYLVKGFLYESKFQDQVDWTLINCEDETVAYVTEALIGLHPNDRVMISIIEDMVAGDSSGDAQNIAKGVTSGDVTFPGPSTINKRKKIVKQE